MKTLWARSSIELKISIYKRLFLSSLVLLTITNCNKSASEKDLNLDGTMDPITCCTNGAPKNSSKELAELVVTNLTCEYQKNPKGVDKLKPRLSWMLESKKRGQKQVAYQVLVASSLDQLSKNIGDVWDSGIIISNQSLNLAYNGSKLKSRSKYYWKVRVCGIKGKLTAWSQPSSFFTGFLSQNEWQGQWIKSDLELFDYQKDLMEIADHNMEAGLEIWARGKNISQITEEIYEAPAVWMRKEFKSKNKKLQSAILFISGLGLYEPYLNGRKINDHFLTVTPHDFGKTVPYHVLDVTHLVSKGENTLGVILGNGYYNPVVPSPLLEYAFDFINTPRLKCELQLVYEDESKQLVRSDTSWRFTTKGPIRFNSIRSGEIYDARKELGDWSSNRFNDKKWKSAIIAKSPDGHLVKGALPPVRVIKTIPAVSVENKEKGVRFDLGIDCTGWARLKLKGKSGQKIKISYPGETTHTLGRYQTYEYICKGNGTEYYEPRFAFNGYRYIDVYGLDYMPKASDLVGRLVVSDLKSVGSFSCSDKHINRLHEINRQTIRNYNVGMPMDPVREKVCWTQDVQTNFETSAYNYNVYEIYRKWQNDFIDAIRTNGYVPTVVPSCFDGPDINGPWWGGMIIYNPWQIYNFYGDKEILAKSYESMKKYFTYLTSISENNIIKWGLGDWLDIASGGKGYPKGTTVSYTSTCAYMMYADILSQTADVLNKDEDVKYFIKSRDAIKKSINKTFYNNKNYVYDTGSQTAYILALKLNIAEDQDRQKVIESLKKQIAIDKNHLSTGFLGMPFLLTLLHEEGLGDLAWKIATQKTYPSWYSMLNNKNSNVFREFWKGERVQMTSLAGPIGAWFYRSLGGIRAAAPGFKSIIIQPYINRLDWVKCTFKSPYGTIVSKWEKKDDIFKMNIVIPANTTATVYLPGSNVKEGSISANKSPGVDFCARKKGYTIIKVRSGEYNFISSI